MEAYTVFAVAVAIATPDASVEATHTVSIVMSGTQSPDTCVLGVAGTQSATVVAAAVYTPGRCAPSRAAPWSLAACTPWDDLGVVLELPPCTVTDQDKHSCDALEAQARLEAAGAEAQEELADLEARVDSMLAYLDGEGTILIDGLDATWCLDDACELAVEWTCL